MNKINVEKVIDYSNILKENERLKEENEILQDMDKILRNENTNLKLRINKAIEFIEKYQIERKVKIGNVELDKSFVNSQGVLDILKGEDK